MNILNLKNFTSYVSMKMYDLYTGGNFLNPFIVCAENEQLTISQAKVKKPNIIDTIKKVPFIYTLLLSNFLIITMLLIMNFTLLYKYDMITMEYQNLNYTYNTHLAAEQRLSGNIVEVAATEPVEYNYTDITQPSNLSEEDLNTIIDLKINNDDSKMHGIGEYLVEMENEYGVNALFCLSVCSLESGYGSSNAAINKNNLFGLISSSGMMNFSSVENCIMYWGQLLRNYYIDDGRTTIGEIQSKYCPNSSTWSTNISSLMDDYVEYAKSLKI